MTAAERLCAELGVSVKAVCKKAEITPRTLNHYVIHGASSYSADRLLWAFDYKADPKIFIWGISAWRKYKDGEIKAIPSGAGGNTGSGQRPVNNSRSNIFTLVKGGKKCPEKRKTHRRNCKPQTRESNTLSAL